MLLKDNLLLLGAILGTIIQSSQSFPVSEVAQVADCYNVTSALEYSLCARSIPEKLLPRARFGKGKGKDNSGGSRDRNGSPNNNEPEAPGRNQGQSGTHFGSGGGSGGGNEFLSDERYQNMIARGRRDHENHELRLARNSPDPDLSEYTRNTRKPDYDIDDKTLERVAYNDYEPRFELDESTMGQSLRHVFKDVGIDTEEFQYIARGYGSPEENPPVGRHIEMLTSPKDELVAIANMDKGKKTKESEKYFNWPVSEEVYENQVKYGVPSARFYFHDDVQEEGTKPLMRRIHNRHGTSNGERLEFGPDDEEFYAYQGSRNGITTGRIVDQHNQQIQRKLIKVHSWDLEVKEKDDSRRRKGVLAFEYERYNRQ